MHRPYRKNQATQRLGVAMIACAVLAITANVLWPSAILAGASIAAIASAGLYGLSRRCRLERATLALIDAIKDGADPLKGGFEMPHDEFGIVESVRTLARRYSDEIRSLREGSSLAFQSFENLQDSVFWMDEAGTVIEANRAACETRGLTHDELVGSSIFDLNAEMNPELWCYLWQRLSMGEINDVESTHVDANGDQFPVRVIAIPVTHNGRLVSCATVRNITQQRRVENAIQSIVGGIDSTSETYFDELCRSLAEALGVRHAIISDCADELSATVRSWWDGEGFSSGITYSLDGTPCEQAVNKDFCFYPDGVAQQFPNDEFLRELGIKGYTGIRMRDADGRTLGILAAMDTKPIESNAYASSLLKLFATRASAEIQRANTERELCEARDRAKRLAAVAENTDNTAFVLDTEHRVTWVNRAFTHVTGYTLDEVAGRTPFDIFRGPDTDVRLFGQLARKLENHEHVEAVVKLYKKDGGFYWSEINASPTYDEAGEFTGYISLERDITEQLEQRDRLAQAQDRAEAANRAKSEFLANMSHEIRTPMTAILGYTELLDGEETIDPSLAREAVSIVRRNGEHLLAIVNDILDISKIEAGKMSVDRVECDLLRVVQQVVTLMDVRATGKGIDLRIACDTPVPARVRTDPTRFRQILANLIGNAIKFTEIGSVTVRVAYDDGMGVTPRVRVTVEDTGIGMDEQQASAAAEFSAFSQIDTCSARKYGGTGLGLRISRALTSLLGGELSFESQLGVGSAFAFTIDPGPLDNVEMITLQSEHAAPTEDAERTRPGGTLTRLDGVRVLFAEDGPDNQRLIGFHLSQAGAEVTLASNGREAVDLIAAHETGKAPYDLILMDMQMPELDGYGATRELRESGCTLPIIAITAHAMEGERERCLAFGCDDYLSKPVDRVLLTERVAANVEIASRQAA